MKEQKFLGRIKSKPDYTAGKISELEGIQTQWENDKNSEL
jgi:hypothetical protein